MGIFPVTRYDTYDKLKRGLILKYRKKTLLTHILENLTRLSQNLKAKSQEVEDAYGIGCK